MLNNKSGFTLAETMVAFGIISVLVGAALLTLKPFDKGIKYLYSSTYYNLDRAFYNTITYWVPKDREARDPFAYTQENGVEIPQGVAARKLCLSLIQYINHVEPDDMCCNGFYVDDLAEDSSFNNDHVQFTAPNGVRFFISTPFPCDEVGRPIETTRERKFYLIYADLNGSKLPNSVTYERGVNRTKDPDIFAFAALGTGRICPLGPPEVDNRYLTTRILYKNDSTPSEDSLKYSSPSKEYIVSQAEAWGYYLPQSAIPSDRTVDDTQFMEEAPLSYNGYIKSIINANSNIYSFLGGQSMATYMQNHYTNNNVLNVRLESNPVDAQVDPGYGCVWRSEDDCKVVVDKYIY